MDFSDKNTVKVDFATVERLVRDSERLLAIKNIVISERYISMTVLENLLEIEREVKKDGI